MLDPVKLAQDLIKCPSITPIEGGAIILLEKILKDMGFSTEIVYFKDEIEEVPNLYARYGKGKNLCFAGHTDVVPVGDEAAWKHGPFAAEIVDGILYGRGAVDMKTAIACFIVAAQKYIRQNPNCSISFLITGDEEARSVNGTVKMLEHIYKNGEKLDGCIVGEPTNPTKLGEMIKIGRRGSISFNLTVHGQQGHVAYPDIALNPITRLVSILHQLKAKKLDDGNEFFQPSNLEVTDLEVGNKAGNVIPAHANAKFNIRFNNIHSAESLKAWVREICEKEGVKYDLTNGVPSDCFITEKGDLSKIAYESVKKITFMSPELSTSGGTSDARFIKNYCPVVEFGLINKTAHKVDENIAVEDIYKLTDIYEEMIRNFFK